MTHNDTININEQNLTSRDLDRTGPPLSIHFLETTWRKGNDFVKDEEVK